MNTKLLRQKILDLAIRGKLTEQKKSDGTTKDLLASIAASSACHAELVSASPSSSAKKNSKATERSVILSKRNASKDLAKEIIPLNKDEAPFEIPENWEWVRLGDVASDFQYGSSEKSEPEGKVAVLRMSNINRMGQVVYDDLVYTSTESEIAKYTLDVGDVLFNRTNSPEWVGKTALYRGDIPAIYAGYIIRIKPKFLPEYLNYLMCSKYERDWAYEVKTDGVHQSNINAQKLMAFTVPLPPLAEQKRIVEAIENAFAEITAIENNQELLKKHIKQGRQKILDLAIRGKLTEQKESDGTTKDLLAQIQDERRETKDERDAGKKDSSNVIASKAKQSKKSKPAEPKTIIPLNKDEAPFEIPENWEWVRLGDLCSSVSSGKTPSTIQKELWNGDILWVTSKDVKQKYIHSTQVCLSELGAQTMRLYPENTMIIVGRSGILRHTLPVSILKHDATINQDLKALIFKDDNLAEYIHAAIKGMEQDLLHRYKKAGTTVDNLNFDEFLFAGIPLPPLAEQQRIVEAIESAFAEFDAMENFVKKKALV